MESDPRSGARKAPSPEQFQELYQLIGGYRVSQAIYVALTLGIPDLLADGPRGSDELAQMTGTHAGALYRLLRFLAGVGLFDEVAPRHFGLTTLGSGFCADTPGSLRATALMLLDPAKWQSWGQLLESVRTGETAFQRVHGVEYFDYLDNHRDAAAIFHQAMTANTARSGGAISRVYDFSGIRRIVDVGGGYGLFLATILQAHPTIQGVLFDLPDVVAGASATLAAAGVLDRCEVVGGDFFASVPAGGDAYILRQIIHDWDDIRAVRILANCRHALEESGKVMVVESAIASDYRRALPVLHLDMEMLVHHGGLQRTEEAYRALFAAAGLRLIAVVPLGDAGQFSVFEGEQL